MRKGGSRRGTVRGRVRKGERGGERVGEGDKVLEGLGRVGKGEEGRDWIAYGCGWWWKVTQCETTPSNHSSTLSER